MDLAHKLRLTINSKNETFEAIVDTVRREEDEAGALYYVVAVVMIYGLSIVMMIASHIRKNKQDSQLRTYLKEMAILRKKDRREKLVTKMVKIGSSISRIGSKNKKSSVLHEEVPKSEGNPDERDADDSKEPLLSKQSNSTSDDANGSVFQFIDDLDDISDLPSTPKTPLTKHFTHNLPHKNVLTKQISTLSQPQPSHIDETERPGKYFRRCQSASAAVHIIREQTSL